MRLPADQNDIGARESIGSIKRNPVFADAGLTGVTWIKNLLHVGPFRS